MELNRASIGPADLYVMTDLEGVYVRVSCGAADLWACAVSLTTTTDIYGRLYE